MSRFSDWQSRFDGGEWSGFMQGRTDDPRYRTALALSLNYLVGEEGSLVRRSGTRYAGHTRNGSPGRLIDWRYSTTQAYLSEFTDGYMRLWQASTGTWAFSDSISITVISTANPAVFTASATLNSSWVTGVYLTLTPGDIDSGAYAPALLNRQFKFTKLSSTTFKLTDPLSDTDISGAAFAGSFTSMEAHLITEIATPYTSNAWLSLRKVMSSHTTATSGGYEVGVEQKVTFLHPTISPRSLSSQAAFKDGLITETFTDGPYLDIPENQLALKPDATSGTINFTIGGWDASTIYSIGDLVRESGIYYISMIDANKNNSPPSANKWTAIQAWSSAATYGLGWVVDYNSTLYFSKIASNNLNQPDTSPTQWQTTPPAWNALASYAGGAWVTDAAKTWITTTLTVGTLAEPPNSNWVQIDVAASWATITDQNTGLQFLPTDVGRLIRLQQGPAQWNNAVAYSTNDKVTFDDNIYKASSGSTGREPDISPDVWTIQEPGALWTWGRITTASGSGILTVILEGDPLQSTATIYTWRAGLYCDRLGWPSCGCWHEGRLWFASTAFPNRFDASMSNDPFNFSPTAPDGTVADDNAISETLNAEDTQPIEWISSASDSLLMGTQAGEWEIRASSLDDPITPTSIQARRVTRFGAANIEPARLPSALAVVHGLKRRIFEYKNWIETTAYSIAKNGANMLDTSSHLSLEGVEELAFVSDPAPTIYARDGAGGIFGIAYRRDPTRQYTAPFSLALGYGETQRYVASIAAQVGTDGLTQNCWMVTYAGTDIAPNYRVEVMQASPFDSPNLYDEWFLDSAIQPLFYVVAGDNLSVLIYGMWALAGETVTVAVGGNDLGEWLVADDGTVNIVFATAGVTVDTWIGSQPSPADEGVTPLSATVGFTYASRGQRLRPVDGGADGPAQGKIRRFERAAWQVYRTHEIKVGTDFSNLYALPLKAADGVSALGLSDLTSGVFRNNVTAKYDFDNMLCWEQSRPYPGVIVGVAGFGTVSDI